MTARRARAAWAAPLLLASVAGAGELRDELPPRLEGREALLLRYLGGDRDAHLGRRGDVRRSVTSYLEPSGEIRYVSGRRFAGIPLEADRTSSEQRLTAEDRRVRDPSERGLEPGEVVRIREVEVDDDEVTLRIDGTGRRDDPDPDERRALLVVRFDAAPATPLEVVERLWEVLIPAPPLTPAEEAGLLGAVVHALPLKTLSDWLGRSLDDAAERVADETLDLSHLPAEYAAGVRGCFAESYAVLSNRYGLALVDLDLREEPAGLELVAEVRPHLPLVGDWASEGARAAAAFDWSAARTLRTLPRCGSQPPLASYRTNVEYGYRGRDGWGRDRLETRVAAEIAAAYAALEITTRDLGREGEHRLNGLPLSLSGRP